MYDRFGVVFRWFLWWFLRRCAAFVLLLLSVLKSRSKSLAACRFASFFGVPSVLKGNHENRNRPPRFVSNTEKRLTTCFLNIFV